jgi:hypothetical protein
MDVVHLTEFAAFDDRRAPKTVAAFNDSHIEVAKVEGDFTWHRHDDTDEVFYVHRGRLTIEHPTGPVELGPGDVYVVHPKPAPPPRGEIGRPIAGLAWEGVLPYRPASGSPEGGTTPSSLRSSS